MAKLSKAQKWARERFLTKGHVTNAVNQFEKMILANSTLPMEGRLLNLALNHLQEMLNIFGSGQNESKKQYMRM